MLKNITKGQNLKRQKSLYGAGLLKVLMEGSFKINLREIGCEAADSSGSGWVS
jgi:hypothetical protein